MERDGWGFPCGICLNLLTEPVTLSCGHNYCKVCVQSYWNRQVQNSCPQCRQSFSTRPVLVSNTMMADLVARLKRTELQYNPIDLETWRQQIVHSIQVREEEQQKLQQEALTLKRRADVVVKHSEECISLLVRELQSVHTDVARQIRALQVKEEAQIKQIQDQLEQEITDLKKTFTETSPETLQDYSPPSAHTHRSYSLPLWFLEQATSAMTKLTEQLQLTLRVAIQTISEGFTSKQLSLPSTRTSAN